MAHASCTAPLFWSTVSTSGSSPSSSSTGTTGRRRFRWRPTLCEERNAIVDHMAIRPAFLYVTSYNYQSIYLPPLFKPCSPPRLYRYYTPDVVCSRITRLR